MIRLIVLALLAVMTFSNRVNALVDMKDANYSETWLDIEVPGGGYALKVSRTYNSRTLFNGIFGFGWCSDFETTLEISPEGNLWVTECGAGRRTTYSPTQLTAAELEKSADTIISKLKAEKVSGRTESFYRDLRKDLIINDRIRNEYAQKYRVSSPPREGLRYLANGKEVEYFVFSKTHFTRHFPDGSFQRFDKDGKIAHFNDKNGNFLKYEYSKGLLVSVVDDKARRLTFKYHPNKKIKEILAPNGLKAEYKFANLDDLSYVKDSWGGAYTYQYDDGHNLTKVTWPDKTFIALKYDQKKDWAMSYTDRDKCVENYTYEDSPSDPKNHYWSTVKKTCGKKLVADNRYEFWHKKDASGQIYLQKVLTEVGGETTEVTYHEVFGKPTSIRKNQYRVTYDYYPEGQVKSKNASDTKMLFTYEPQSKRISKVVIDYLNDKNVKVLRKWTNFKWDAKGNLSYAENSDGQKVSMKYDNRGRVISFIDQTRKVVKIGYDERYGKPTVLSRPGLGSIKVSYDKEGVLKNVESKEGTSVAVQVASAFNVMLEVTKPALAEVYL